MEWLIITLGVSGVCGLIFAIWLHTKSGRKWHDAL